ncbi:hypothetical protein PHLCEN_2v10181, partial [Hermanssonia centrifuga]
MFSIIRLVPNITNLGVNNKRFELRVDPKDMSRIVPVSMSESLPSDPLAKNLRIEKLTVVSVYMEVPTLQFIAQTEAVHILRYLSVSPSTSDAVLASQDLIRRSAKNLEFLSINFGGFLYPN